MTWVILLLAIAGAVLAFSVPVAVSVSLHREVAFKAQIRMRWLFLRVKKDLRRRPEEERRVGHPKRSRNKRRESIGSSWGVGRVRAALRVRGLSSTAYRFGTALARSIRLVTMDGTLRVGMSDPADTGRLCAIVAPCVTLLNGSRHVDLRFQPSFQGSELTFHLEGKAHVYPARIARACVLTVFSVTGFRLLVALMGSRSRGK